MQTASKFVKNQLVCQTYLYMRCLKQQTNLSNIPKATERTRTSAYFSEHSLQDASSRLIYNLNWDFLLIPSCISLNKISPPALQLRQHTYFLIWEQWPSSTQNSEYQTLRHRYFTAQKSDHINRTQENQQELKKQLFSAAYVTIIAASLTPGQQRWFWFLFCYLFNKPRVNVWARVGYFVFSKHPHNM